MPSFYCKVGTSDGRIVEKEFESAGRELLREHLEEQGFFIFSIRKRRLRPLLGGNSIRSGFSGRRFLSFNQEFLVLIRSGLPVLQVLDTINDRMEAGPIALALREIREEVKGGSALSEAFSKYPNLFPHLYVASIKSGERTGDLAVNISRYIAYQKRVEAIKAKVRSASFYPVLLCLAVAVVLLFLLLYVIPSFTQIYADAQVQLPLLTRILITVAEWMTNRIAIWLPLVIAFFLASRFFIGTEKGSLLLDRVKLVLPFFGPLFIEYALSSFCRTLSTILASGIPLVDALQMARGTLNNRVLEGKLGQAVLRVQEVTSLSAALDQLGFFPLIALRMIAVGETTGSLGDMLTDVSDYYEGEVERRLDRLTTLIEPLMMLSMGLLIGGIVVAMYIPIFQLAGTVR